VADLMLNLIQNVLKTKYGDLPDEAIDYAKRSVLDIIGATIAGSTADGCKAVVDQVKEWGGKEESTIPVYGGKVPMPFAGMAMAPMARARELGDIHPGGSHISEYIIPTALPIAECRGGISGKEFITAIALGQDMGIRLRQSLPTAFSFPFFDLVKVFAATATAAKLFHLDEDTMYNAMGIAFSQASAEGQSVRDGMLTVRIFYGFVACNAIVSVLLAQRGITGAKNILEGELGLYKGFPGHDVKAITSELGKRFEGAYTCMKAYSCCIHTHAAINATIDLVKENNIKPQDVDEIDVGVGERPYELCGQPREAKINPKTIIDCQFSIPYTVATAVVKKNVWLEDFTEEAIRRPDIRELMRKINSRLAPEVVKPDFTYIGGAAVTIKTRDGKKHSKTIYYIKGHPKNPLTMDELTEKLKSCLPYSAKPFLMKKIEQITEMVRELEKVDDVDEIARLIVP